jgi:hypothetical protein
MFWIFSRFRLLITLCILVQFPLVFSQSHLNQQVATQMFSSRYRGKQIENKSNVSTTIKAFRVVQVSRSNQRNKTSSSRPNQSPPAVSQPSGNRKTKSDSDSKEKPLQQEFKLPYSDSKSSNETKNKSAINDIPDWAKAPTVIQSNAKSIAESSILLIFFCLALTINKF